MLIHQIKKIILVLSLGLSCLLGVAGQTLALPANFTDEAVVTGLNQPTNLVNLPDGRMLVLLKGGEIKIFDPSTIPATATTYLTITDIESNEERGLASIVLDPDFATNNYFYVYYTHGSSARNRISRFTHLGNTADLSSEVMIWQDNENWSDCCHYGGGLDFGPDGKLYLTTGEEFDGNQSPDLTRAGGKIIRINSDGTIPNDNPFVDGPGGNLDEIWAFGLRNPYRAKWDLLSGRFFIGDVGGNVQSTAREEINLGQAGRNYGWPNGEGTLNIPAYVDPIYDYGHLGATPNGGAVTAGMVYRGSEYPSQYYGSFFFADYAVGTISYLDFDAGGAVIGVTEFSNTVNNVVSVVEGSDGAVYYTDIAGQVRRIVYNSGNQPPAITGVSAIPASGPSPLNVTLSVSVTDPEGDPLTYHWVFGDGTEADGGSSIAHTYAEGAYTAYVQVSDPAKTSTSDPVAIQSGNPPVPTITAPLSGDLFQALDTINYAGTATDPDETLSEFNYSWTVRFLHNAHTHPVLNDAIGSTGSFQINDSGHDYVDFTGYELILTVTDSAGLTGTDRIEIYPDKVNLNLATSPAGQNVFLDGISHATPLAYDTMIGFRHTVSAPGSFCDVPNDTVYVFSSWSDGGAQTHEITVPAVDMNLTANYVANGTCSNLTTAGLALHLEVDQGLTISGSTVTGWVDQSGFGNNLTSVGSPQLVTEPSLNDLQVVDFNGVGDLLERKSVFAGLPTGNADRTVFLLSNYRGTGFGGFAYGDSVCNQAFGTIVDNTGKLTAQGFCTANDFATSVTGTGAGWAVQMIVLEAGVMTHFKDGVLLDTQSHTYNTQLSDMVLGGELGNGNFVDMQAAAVLVYDRALSTVEQQQTFGYLQSKYLSTTSALAVTTTTLPDGTMNAAYSETLVATGGTAPYTWSVATGALPQGLTLDGSTGVISGTPTTAQTANFTVSVADSAAASDTSGTLLLTIRDGTGNSPATVFLDGPAEGATIVGSDVLVSYTLAGTGYDHMHLTLDSDPHITIMNLTGSYLLSNVAPGLHSITLQLVNAQHTPLSNPESNATVNITTEAVPNSTPIAVDDSGVVATGGSGVLDVLSNDSDPDGTLDNTSVTIMTSPANGTLVDDGAGLLTYTHDGGVTTSDSFTYKVADNLGAFSNVATVSLTIGTQPVVTNGLILQLEPDQGLYVNGGTVQSWADQSGLGNDLVSAGNPQLVNAADLNNHLVVDFDGVGDKLERTLTLNGFPTGNTDRTVYMVAKYRGTGFGGFAYGTAGCNQAFGSIVDATGNLTIQGWCGANDYVSTELGTGAGWLIQSAVLNGGTLTHYKDGVQIDSAFPLFNTVLTNMVLGAELDSAKSMDMQVAAVLVYDRALNTAELQQVGVYLNDKYITGVGGNLSPVANDDSGMVANGAAIGISVLANDGDADGTLNNASVTIMTAPVNGMVVDDGNGLLTYTHDGSATTSDSFTYTVADNVGATSNTATVTLTIGGTGNASPVANDDNASVATGGTKDIAVLLNDTDSDGTLDNTSVVIVNLPSNGTVTDDGNGLLTYTHDGGVTTSDSFTYTVADDLGATSNIATVSLLVGAQSIVTNGLVMHFEPDQGVSTSGSSVLSWADQSGLGNDLQSIGDPQLVTAADLNNHQVVDFDGINDKLERTLTLNGMSAGNTDRTAYMLVKYRGVGFGGFAYGTADCNQAFGLVVDGSGNLTAQGYCNANDLSSTEPGTGAGWVVQSAVLSGGTLTHYKDGVQIDTAPHTYNTVLTNAVLGAELSSAVYVDMQVAMVAVYNRALSTAELQQVDSFINAKYIVGAGGNLPPTANDDSGAVVNGAAVAITVLGNDSDPDGTLDNTSVAILTPPVNGMVVDDGSGLLTYTHDGGATTSDSFTYTVADNLGAISNVATVTLAINQPPLAVDDSATATAPGAAVVITVLSNDSDADGTLDNTTVTIVSPAVNGTVVDDGAGVLTYTHDGSVTASDSFTYTVADNLGAVSNTATVNLTINQRPIAVDDNAAANNAAAVAIAVLANDSDVDGSIDNTTVTILTPPVNGAVVDDGAGVLTYTHNGSATVSDSFTYMVADNLGAVSNSATVTLTINQPPVAVDDNALANVSGSVDITVLINDSDPDGTLDATSVAIMMPPANGNVMVDGTGLVTYTHNGSATVSDSFSYTVADNMGAISNTATVTLAINQLPVAVGDNAIVTAFGSVDIAVLTNDSDADGTINNSSVTIVMSPANGNVVDDGAGLLTYTHDGSATVSDSFSYTVMDDQGAISNVATVAITVTAIIPDGDVAPLGLPDGLVNAADILVMTRMVLGEIVPTAEEIQRGDLYPVGSPDGVIDMSDLILLQQQVISN